MAAPNYWQREWFSSGYYPEVWFAPGDETDVPEEELRRELPPGGHWKHLFKAARDAVAEVRRVSGAGRVAICCPECVVDTAGVEVVALPVCDVGAVGRCEAVVTPLATVRRVFGRGRVGRARARGRVAVYAHGVSGTGLCFAHAGGAVFARAAFTFGSGYVGRAVVKTIQNPTEEMLLALL